MNYFKKLFSSSKQQSSKDKEALEQEVNLSLDDAFVHNFISKGGKFLYATSIKEISGHFKNILRENNWDTIFCCDNDLLKVATKENIDIQTQFSKTLPFFTTCEHLISNNGNILFSSNQLASNKLFTFSENFIVYATTSQIVGSISEGLTGIKTNFDGNIPTNICSLKNYSIHNIEESPIEFSNSNTKNLYLLLFEDL